jgi:hypothetical protein
MAIGEPAFDEAAYEEDDEVSAPDDTDAGGDALCPDEPVIPPTAGTLGLDPAPTDGSRVGTCGVADGTDGVGTVGVRGGACTGSGTLTGGGLGTVTVTGGGLGTVIVGTVTVGTVRVSAAGGETVGSEGTVGTVSAGLAWGRASSTSNVAKRIPARVTAGAPRVQAPARFVSRSWTPLRHPLIAANTDPFF